MPKKRGSIILSIKFPKKLNDDMERVIRDRFRESVSKADFIRNAVLEYILKFEREEEERKLKLNERKEG